MKNRKLVVILAISFFFLLNTFTLTNGLATIIQEDAIFNLNKEDPLGPEGYGALIPSPNTAGALYIDGKNQGKFTIMDWDGGSTAYEEIVDYPGEDISLYYPTTLDNYGIGSISFNDEIDPWNDIRWLNASAYNAEAEILSPFTVSTVFDYYVMKEGGVFTQPFNYDHPMQIDLIVKSAGPKVLKIDWLTVGSVTYGYILVSPSGKPVECYVEDADFMGINVLYEYLIFSASEVGAYRLIVGVISASDPASLNLEFLAIDISSLPLNTVKFAGNFDDFATLDISKTAMWQSNWFKFTGKKGEIFKLDIYQDFASGPDLPTIDIWTPCANGYFYESVFVMGSHDIYFGKSGAAYISFTDTDFGDWYRYSLLLSKADNEKYTLGDTSMYSISMDEIKTIEFSLQEESIVRFNYTSLPSPPGAPALDALGTSNAFIYTNSKEYICYDINEDIFTQTVDSTDFYWHYMPAGIYKAVIKNVFPTANGLFQISSKVYGWANVSIPVNNLTYPVRNPSEFVTLSFEADEELPSLKNPIGIDIELPEIGQYRLNTTMWVSDNDGAAATSFPSHLYLYNSTPTADYYSFGYPQPAFSLDGDSTVGDFLYIGAPTRWTGMAIEFAVPGTVGSIEIRVHDDISDNFGFLGNTDGTLDLTQDGTIEFNLLDSDFDRWGKGSPISSGSFDIPGIDENNYYWMRIGCTGDYTPGTVPIIQQITLLNNTIRGNLFYDLIGESEFEYSDYWDLNGIYQPTGLRVGLDDDLDISGDSYTYDSQEGFIIQTGFPYTIGFEGGTYKLLIIPNLWDYTGSIKIQLAVEDFWPYRHQETYDIATISPTPNITSYWINNYTTNGYGNGTGPFYDYKLNTQYNHTEATILSPVDRSYFALECYGKAYQWTQLVVAMEGVADYNLYILQDLPWITPSEPNNEFMDIATNVNENFTHEFGVFSDYFVLLFQVNDAAEIISFNITLSQYDTVLLFTSDLKASYTPPLDPTLVIALVIIIPSAAGVAVVVYILKKKGKILTKRPT